MAVRQGVQTTDPQGQGPSIVSGRSLCEAPERSDLFCEAPSLTVGAKQKAKFWSVVGQGSIEFLFALIMVLLLVYGLVQATHWVMVDAIDRRRAHDAFLQTSIDKETATQLNPDAYTTRRPDLEALRYANE